ncbi:hypothetical protein F5X68DRAFT_224919 [Plectosphaerella plurivora]|uniref:Uncharacterized protein n=1 Tax=Plectosphaerella plurivora TaxID=936078 RepID=A0A9P8V3X5_9PEZI|nr:hypothetical protein F5X68DRAFT_224919 [Plectosphaerella plurivora]
MSGIGDQCQRLHDSIEVLTQAIAQIPAIGTQPQRFDVIRQHLDGMKTANSSLQEKAVPFDDGTTPCPDEIKRASLAQAETTGDSPPYASTSINNDILALKARLADDRDMDTNGVQVAVISEFLDSLQRYASAHSGNVVGPSMANQALGEASGSGNLDAPGSSAPFGEVPGPGLPIPAYSAVDIPRAPHRIHLRHVSRLPDLEYEPLDIVFDPASKVPRVAVADFYSRVRFFHVRDPKAAAGNQDLATLAQTMPSNGVHLRIAPTGPPRFAVLTETPIISDLAEQGHDGVHFNKSTINVHDYPSAGRVAHIRRSNVRPFDFSIDGKLLAIRGSRGRIEVLTTTGGRGAAVVRGHTDEVVDARFTSDGTGLVSMSKDGTLRVTSTTTWQGTAKLEILEWRNPVFLAVPATGSSIVMSAWGRQVYLWNPDTGALDKWRLDGGEDEGATEGWPLAASPDLRFLCCRTDQGADVREVASGRVLCRLGFGAGFATAAAWSQDSKMLALGRIVGGNFGIGSGRIDFWEVIE